MSDKKEISLKEMTKKYAVGIGIIWVIFINLVIFLWGVEISLEANRTIIGGNEQISDTIILYVIKFISIMIMYIILNKVILSKNKLDEKNVGKLIRNVSYINIIFLFLVCIGITIKVIKTENILPLFSLYSLIIGFINIMEGIWINRILKIEKEVKKSQRKEKIVPLVGIMAIILITTVTNVYYNYQKQQKILKMEIMVSSSIEESEIKEIKEKLNKISYIQKIEYSSQENNFRQMQEEINLNGMDDLMHLLPKSFIITIQEKNKDKVEESINKINGIKKVIVRQEE